ncbi:hypothetical protein Vadar_031560 [Vaccinium darrowii]|uniref:Uncharacterized protein n=1 Tax=Vaccinium darrowii TaxID=229202 RepID=A0ACB7XWC6_9ERIC|nr:hypothetical protein Vadar_031560 [Vaccinium darrowii]
MEGVCGTAAAVSKKMMSILLLVYLVSNYFADYRSVAQNLPLVPQQEVLALEAISTKLQIKNWKISQSFCSDGFVNGGSNDPILTNITCNNNATHITNPNATHVTNIQLKGQNLTGNLPAEFTDLTFLQEIDLTRNYISGTIPTTFANLPLTNLSLLGNRINGSIPKEIGDIATLEGLLLSANSFTGSIPEEFSKLKNLTDFRIDGSTLSGNIPDLIGNWTKIRRLDMQGTSMSGPIPSTISQLINLEELRISDLTGSDMKFPDLQTMTKLKYLVLRNCLITGPIPDYIGRLPSLKTLDLSFNKLSGEIPASLQADLDFMSLSNNSLTGALPVWITNNGNKKIDVSYNNFNESSGVACHTSSVNLVSSRSFTESNLVDWCVKKDLPCSTSPKNHELFINCGGSRITAEGKEYEDDSTRADPSYFFVTEKWAYSSTGVFMNNEGGKANNSFSLDLNGAEFYKTARLAPISLKYYGLCLRKGSYKVRLHFAEIMFSDDQTFSSLGRRIFNVAIQGKEVLTDFNIKEKAGGVGIGIPEEFPEVLVNGSTLEIHLYWKGKGTNSIPDKGVYGPLISAIEITPNFNVSTGPSIGAIVGIGAASFVFFLLILEILRMKGCLGGKDLEDKGKI